MAWAVGSPGVKFLDQTGAHLGSGIGGVAYVQVNLVAGGANVVAPFNMNAPMLAFGIIFVLVIGSLDPYRHDNRFP